MTWFRVDDLLPDHVKHDALEALAGSPAALAAAWMVWLHMGCDCARRTTDGWFTLARSQRVVRLPPEDVERALASLVTVGLLDADGHGYRFHDWADYQPTREELRQDRRSRTERQRRWRQRVREQKGAAVDAAVDRLVDASTPPSTDASTDASTNASRDTSPAAVSVDAAPSRPVPSRPTEENTVAPTDAKPSVRAGADPAAAGDDQSDDGEEEEKTDPRGKRRPDELPPRPGTPQHHVFEVLRSDPQLAPIVSHPSELSRRLTDPQGYPGLHPLAEVKRAAAWLAANPKSRKKNGARFLVAWFDKAQERVRPAAGTGPRTTPGGVAATGQRYATGNLDDLVR